MTRPQMPNKGFTFPAIAALGLAIFGAMKYKKALAEKAKDTTPNADGIDVGTTPTQPIM